MTAAKKPAPKKAAAGPLFTAQTKILGGVTKLFQVCEDLRTYNTDGYLPKVSTVLSWIQDSPFLKGPTKAVVCSPFTANAIAAAFDPTYTADKGQSKDNPLTPKFNAGADPLPFSKFYSLHNGDYPIQSIVNYGLGEVVKDLKTIQRGDYLAIDWYFPPPPPPPPGGKPGKQRYGGHSVFCWDVHRNAAGETDAIQIIGSNGSIAPPGGYGVSIGGCTGKPWFTGTPAGAKGTGGGDLAKASGPVFVDSPDVIAKGTWFVLPGVKAGTLDKSFVAKAKKISYPGTIYGLAELHVARFFTDTPAPFPYVATDGSPSTGAGVTPKDNAAAAPAGGAAAEPPGQIDVKSTPVVAATAKSDPAAAQKVTPRPATQDATKPLASQLDVEKALQEFYAARWISTDPGSPDAVNDAQSQEAIKEFQKKFGLDVDGIAGPKTKKMMGLQLPACTMQLTVQAILLTLKAAGFLDADPGPVDPTNNDAVQAAVKEFQGQVGVPQTGIPDAATQEKLKAKVAASAPTSEKQGLSPKIIALYWLGNGVPPGGTATLRLSTNDVKLGQQFQVFLKDVQSGKEVDAGAKLSVSGTNSELVVTIPSDFALGSILVARVTGDLGDGRTLEMPSQAPIYVRVSGPNPNCADCKALQALIDDGTIEKKVFQRHNGVKGDKAAITSLQKHLVQFGYDLGPSGPDGDFGDTTMKILSFFFIELGQGYLHHKVLTAEHAKIVLQNCQSGFKSKNSRKSPPPAQPASKDTVYSSQIKIGDASFVDWFNGTFQPKHTDATQGDFDNKIWCPGNFSMIFDRISEMSGSTTTPLNQFIALFSIFYNEEGGTFLPLPEEPEIIGGSKAGGLAYCFYGSTSKGSYNTGGDHTVKAGDGLKAMGKTLSADELAQWNGPTTIGVDCFPYNAPKDVLDAAKNCDFFKYRGHGLSQITYRSFHKTYVDPVLASAGYPKKVVDMTTRELDQAFTDPTIYLGAVKNEWHDKHYTGPAFAAVGADTSKFFDVGYHIGGSKSYGTKFALRCNTLRAAMIAAGIECT